jgi:hypothetical protein
MGSTRAPRLCAARSARASMRAEARTERLALVADGLNLGANHAHGPAQRVKAHGHLCNGMRALFHGRSSNAGAATHRAGFQANGDKFDPAQSAHGRLDATRARHTRHPADLRSHTSRLDTMPRSVCVLGPFALSTMSCC